MIRLAGLASDNNARFFSVVHLGQNFQIIDHTRWLTFVHRVRIKVKILYSVQCSRRIDALRLLVGSKEASMVHRPGPDQLQEVKTPLTIKIGLGGDRTRS